MAVLELSTDIMYVKGVGPRRAKEFAEAGIHTVEDALYYVPFRYEDRSHFRPIDSLRAGEHAAVRGHIEEAGVAVTARRRMRNYRVVVQDASGAVEALWFNQPYLENTLKTGRDVILYGLVKRVPFSKGRRLHFVGPDHEIIVGGEDPVHMGGLVPVYERVGAITPKYLRRVMRNLVENLTARLPELLPREAYPSALAGLSRREAFCRVHFPKDETSEEMNAFSSAAQRRLIFEEFFILQCGLLLRRAQVHDPALEAGHGHAFKTGPKLRAILKDVLPFHLTKAQRKAFKEIVDDMTSPHPMHRLLQGDVGSGKTIVALLSMLIAVENRRQAALMAPTEILAEQHFLNFRELLRNTRYRVILLTGSKKGRRRSEALRALALGDADIVVGTHAVIQENADFRRLGFVVVDEQHRFGVLQRAALSQKGKRPDVLVMTATPIPRSLALTVYGDLDVSVIDELPPGRRPVTTRIAEESKRGEVYAFVRREIAKGAQVYMVYPIIEESKTLNLKALNSMVEELRSAFPKERIGVLHGRLKSEEKADVMANFKTGKLSILASTTVVEVGVDVPNASLMVVENAERFGLAQLHQLRGRVGRGRRKSYCVLLAGERTGEEARLRLATMERTCDGFEIADVDLRIRGPGDFFGKAQSGLPPLRVGNIIRDRALMEEARRLAKGYLASLAGQGRSERAAALRVVTARWKDKFGLVEVG